MVVGGGIWWQVVVVVGGGGGRPLKAPEGPRRPLGATEASSRAHILVQQRESSPSTPPGPLKLRLFWDCFGRTPKINEIKLN